MDKQKLAEARQLAMSMTSHPVAFGTIDHTERAGELLSELAHALDQKHAENAALKHDLQYARDGLTKGRTRMREDNERLRAALLRCARQAEALKRECGMNPESPQAIRNAQYQSISTTAHIALGTIRGPEGA